MEQENELLKKDANAGNFSHFDDGDGVSVLKISISFDNGVKFLLEKNKYGCLSLLCKNNDILFLKNEFGENGEPISSIHYDASGKITSQRVSFLDFDIKNEPAGNLSSTKSLKRTLMNRQIAAKNVEPVQHPTSQVSNISPPL